jgi:hypothetical protein
MMTGDCKEVAMATTTKQKSLSAADKKKLDDKQFAFPKERKEPLVDAKHVRNAVARFDQVEGVTDKERDLAWRRIKAAAKKFDVKIEEKSWHDLFSGAKAKPAKQAAKKK